MDGVGKIVEGVNALEAALNSNRVRKVYVLDKKSNKSNKLKDNEISFFAERLNSKEVNIDQKITIAKGFFEYFSCKNGQPMGAKNFSWSAALYLDLKLNKN